MSSAQQNFSSGDIAKIIAACSKHGVENFEFEGLKLTFLTKKEESNNNIASVIPIEIRDTSYHPSDTPQSQAIEEIDEAYETDAFRINDPLGFEEDMILARRRDSQDAN